MITRRCLCTLLVLLLVLLVADPYLHAQDQRPCAQRLTRRTVPTYDVQRWCLETVLQDDAVAAAVGRMAYTALAAGSDGVLYAARPLHGEIYAISDQNGDGLPDTPALFASGLTLPNGLVYHEDALYAAGGPHLYRITPDGVVQTLVDDLPAGGGFWTGGLVIGPDDRLVVVTGAPCDACIPENAARGAVLSFALDGTDRRLVATGLRAPVDLAFAAGALWTTDTPPFQREAPLPAELNRVEQDAFFGFPDCWGDCPGVTAPALALPANSGPLGLAAYHGDAFPDLQGTLLVVLGGEPQSADLSHLELIALSFDAEGQPIGSEILLPAPYTQVYQEIRAGTIETQTFSGAQQQLAGQGFYPHRPIDVTVSREGWIYLSTGGGRILALRP